MMAMLSYRSQPSFEMRFGRRPQTEDLFAIESYLRYQGQQLVDRFDPATYVTLTRAMDTHDVSRGRGDFDDVLRSIRQPTLVVSIDSDVLYWPWEQREVARLVPNARLAVMDSPHGHDAFLIDVDRLDDMVADFRGRSRPVRGRGARRRRRPARRPSTGSTRSRASRCSCSGRGRWARSCSSRSATQRTELERDYDTVLRVVGVADRRGTAFDEDGIDLARWREALAAAPATGPFDAASAPAVLDRLARLPRPVLVDLTAADGMEDVYEQAFRRGIHVVASNKRPLAVAPRRLEQLRLARRQHHAHYHYDTAVGASLPVIGTLRRLVRSGDRVRLVEGSLSGTLGYLCTRAGPRRAALARDALGDGARLLRGGSARRPLRPRHRAQGAHPRARARRARCALEDVKVEPFVPRSCSRPGTPDDLIAALRARRRARWRRRCGGSRQQGTVLRYLARIAVGPDGKRRGVASGRARSGATHPAARLVGVEAFVAFTTARHAERPARRAGRGRRRRAHRGRRARGDLPDPVRARRTVTRATATDRAPFPGARRAERRAGRGRGR